MKVYNKGEVTELIAGKLRNEIIENPEKYYTEGFLKELGIKDPNEDVDIFGKFDKRFSNIINFLSRPEVRTSLGDPRKSGVEKDYFFSKQMSITRSAIFKGENNAYQMNVIDTLFMGSLMLCYNHSSFVVLRKKNPLILTPELLLESWETDFEKALNILCEFLKNDIKEDANLPSVDIIKINLISLLWRFSPLIEKYNQGITGDLAGIAAAYEALPEKLKEEFYNKDLAKPLKKITKKLLELIKEMKTSEDQKNYNEFTSNFNLEYDAYELLNELPVEYSISDLTNLLKNKFYDKKNEPEEK